jgi:hypothetical protein
MAGPVDPVEKLNAQMARAEKLIDALEFRLYAAETAIRLLAAETDAALVLSDPAQLAALRKQLRGEYARDFDLAPDDLRLEGAIDDLVDTILALIGDDG